MHFGHVELEKLVDVQVGMNSPQLGNTEQVSRREEKMKTDITDVSL